MRGWSVVAVVVVAACADTATKSGGGGGGKADDPNAVTHVTTAWETRVGEAGDAVVHHVMTLDDGNLLATSSSPRWVLRLSPSGQFNAPAIPDGTNHEDALYIESYWHPTHEVWQVSSNELVGVDGEGGDFELRGYTADGLPNPMFGSAGVVTLPGPTAADDTVVSIDYDSTHDRFLALVIRAWESTPQFTIGPSQIEILAVDAHTGAQTSAGTFTLPPWEGGNDPEAGKLRSLITQPDGSFLVLATSTFYVQTAPGVTELPVTRYEVFHLAEGAAPTAITLTVSDYVTYPAAFTRLGGGRFDLYLDGAVDYTSADKKLARFSLDDALAPRVEDLGAAVDFEHGCAAAGASSSELVYGHSATDRTTGTIELTAYPKGRQPYTFTSDKPQRCLVSLSLGAAGQLYAGTWDTTNTGWTALLTALVPQ